jgi:hypothetical protein
MPAALLPIALPPLNNVVNLPPQPQNPPSAVNVVEGRKYLGEIKIAYGMSIRYDGSFVSS